MRDVFEVVNYIRLTECSSCGGGYNLKQLRMASPDGRSGRVMVLCQTCGREGARNLAAAFPSDEVIQAKRDLLDELLYGGPDPRPSPFIEGEKA
jgi:hypothetical protein